MADGRRPSQKTTTASRLAALEDRVSQLERELAALRPAPRPAKVTRPVREGLRCPGCSLPVQSIARGTCPWCGFVYDAVSTPPRRR